MGGLLLDIVRYLEAEGIVKGDGIDAFRDFEPTAPDSILVLTEYQGQGPTPYDDLVHRSVQILVRGTDPTETRRWATEVYNSMAQGRGKKKKFTQDRWGQVYLRQPPFKIKVDEQGRSYYGFNVGISTYND